MTIKDENLKPYIIRKSDANYNVFEDTFKVNKHGEPIEKLHGYFTSVENALKKIIRLKVETDDSIYTVMEYINKLKITQNIVLDDK